MKYEDQYYELLVVDEVWIRQDGELIKLEPEEKEDEDEHDTQGQ
jgi:hypothetical protein